MKRKNRIINTNNVRGMIHAIKMKRLTYIYYQKNMVQIQSYGLKKHDL